MVNNHKRKVKYSAINFGGTKAATTLSELLNELCNTYIGGKVSEAFHSSTRIFKTISNIKNKDDRILLMNLVLTNKIKQIQSKTLSNEIKSFLINCISAQHDIYLKSIK